MTRPPLQLIALALAAGNVGPTGGAMGLSLVVAGLVVAWRTATRRAALILALFAGLGASAGALASGAAARDCRTRLPDGARLWLRGALLAQRPDDGSARMLLEGVGSRGRAKPCRGMVVLVLPEGQDPDAGAELSVRGRWLTPAIPDIQPGRPFGTVLADRVEVLAPAGAGHHPLLAVRGALQRRVRTLYPARHPLVDALLLARKEGLAPDTRDRFARAGMSHLLAISGFHVALMAGLVLLLARMAGSTPVAGLLIALLLTAAYVAFLGAPYAAVRAGLQIGLLAGARLLQRPADPLGLVAAAAVLIMTVDPLAVRDVGFQLSFAGTAGIIAWRRSLLERMGSLPGPLAELLCAGVAAFAGTAPIAALHFGRLAPIGLLANLAAVPLLSLAVPAVVVSLLASFVWAPAGPFLAGGADLVLAGLDAVAGVAAATPLGQVHVTASAAVACGLVGGVGVYLWPRLPALRPRVRLAVFAAATWSLAIAWPVGVVLSPDAAVEIHAIDVGQGDALAIRSPGGRWAVVDAGPRSDRFDAGRARVVPYLLRQGTRRVELLILSHPDADHIGGAESLMAALDVGTVLDPGAVTGKSLFVALLRRAEGTRWLAARAGRRADMDGVSLEFLAPPRGALDATRDANDFSVVFRLRYGRFSALFTGDAPAAVERSLVEESVTTLRSTVLKVGHHGSNTSTDAAFLDAVRPEIAVIAVGRHNRFGHPHRDVLGRLTARGIRALRTDRHGTIAIRGFSDGSYEIRTERAVSERDPGAGSRRSRAWSAGAGPGTGGIAVGTGS